LYIISLKNIKMEKYILYNKNFFKIFIFELDYLFKKYKLYFFIIFINTF
jgi:hypothetical protein